jgi:hypothetical protein
MKISPPRENRRGVDARKLSRQDRTCQSRVKSASRNGSPPGAGERVRQEKPVWDAEGHTLFWRGERIKHFRQVAPVQEALLAAFQRAGWNAFLDVALLWPCFATKQVLCDTVRNLNRSVRPHLHFSQEGSGSRCCWRANGEARGCYPNATQSRRLTSE